MVVLDASIESLFARESDLTLRCMVCRRPFDFEAGEYAVILKHVEYWYDFAHPGRCAETAMSWIFPEPGYDGPAFGPDRLRLRVTAITPASGWAVVRGDSTEVDALQCWAMIEHADGTRQVAGVVRDPQWTDAPGGAELTDFSNTYVFDPMAELSLS